MDGWTDVGGCVGGQNLGSAPHSRPVCLQTVLVQVFPVQDQVPLEVPGSIRSVRVKENELVFITEAHLHFADGDDPGADLTYEVTRACFSPVHPG